MQSVMQEPEVAHWRMHLARVMGRQLTWPDVVSYMRMSKRSSVDLPLPDGPTMAQEVPGATEMLTPFSTSLSAATMQRPLSDAVWWVARSCRDLNTSMRCEEMDAVHVVWWLHTNKTQAVQPRLQRVADLNN